jgi:hypothetical protein
MQESHNIRIARSIHKRLGPVRFDSKRPNGGTGVPARAGLGFSLHACDFIPAYATGSSVSYTLTIEI